MAVKAKPQKDPAAVALGRKGGKKGGLARAANLTPEQRSEIARKAVQARWDRGKANREISPIQTVAGKAVSVSQQSNNFTDSDRAVLEILQRIKATDDPSEIRSLSDQLERAIFHKQYPAA